METRNLIALFCLLIVCGLMLFGAPHLTKINELKWISMALGLIGGCVVFFTIMEIVAPKKEQKEDEEL